MTMNMPPPYNQSPNYLQIPPPGYGNIQAHSNLSPSYETVRASQHKNPPTNLNQFYSANVNPHYLPNHSNTPIQHNSPHNINRVSPNISRDNVGRQYLHPQINQVPNRQISRQNNFMRQPQQYPHYLSPNHHPVYPQQSHQPQPIYQRPNYPHYQGPMPQTYPAPYYNPQTPQNYVPLYTSPTNFQNFQPVNSMLYNQARRNIPEQSINSNFNYEHANFDCNYSVEQNLVHCVLCNQTYRTNQKKQHLELHREKVKNVNIRPVDQQQLQRLEKYNGMTKKGLIIKPIVEPDQFNVQYNPNEFVLRKITQYRDVDTPRTNQIHVQTGEDHHQSNRPQDLGYSESRRSQASSPQRSQSNRVSQNQAATIINKNTDQSEGNIQDLGYGESRRTQELSPQKRSQSNRVSEGQAANTMNRNTNTRFNADSVREEEQIFLSDRFEQNNEGETFKSSYKNQQSMGQSERISQRSQQLGYGQPTGLKARNAESINRPEDLGYSYEESGLHSIREDNEYRRQNSMEISMREIIKEVQRDSQY